MVLLGRLSYLKLKLGFHQSLTWDNLLIHVNTKHYVKSVQVRSYFWSVFFCIRTQYRKIRTRSNSVFGHFHAVNGCDNMTLKSQFLISKSWDYFTSKNNMKKRETNSENKVKKYIFINFDDENSFFDPRRIDALDQRYPLDKEFLKVSKHLPKNKKHLCWSLFLSKLQARRPATLFKRDSGTVFFPCKFYRFVKNFYFTEHLQTSVSGRGKNIQKQKHPSKVF